jgi:hypothetical protein
VADLVARRARVWQAVMGTDGLTSAFAERADAAGLRDGPQQHENVYDGANSYIHVGDNWTSFWPGDPAGPRGPNDPLWPLDALAGANDDVTELGPDSVRGVPATHYRLTVDLARADSELPAGVSVPSGPYRSLGRLPAEVWLDSDGLARRISVNPEPTASGEQTWAVAELWDFGIAVDIAPPGPSEMLAPAKAFKAAYPEEDSEEA